MQSLLFREKDTTVFVKTLIIQAILNKLYKNNNISIKLKEL